MPPSEIKYLQALVIVHGKSEYKLVHHIKSNLHLRIDIFAKNQGKNSIQINGLKNVLNSGDFRTFNSFKKAYSVECERNTFKNFKVFIIMDTDDCDEETKTEYINGNMFKGHWLHPYIVPIYNIKNLEDILVLSGILKTKPSASEKGKTYTQVFPINSKPLSYDTVAEVKTLRKRLEPIKETNLCVFIDYCLNSLDN